MTSVSQQTVATDRIASIPFKDVMRDGAGAGARFISIDRYGFVQVYFILSVFNYESNESTDYIKMAVRLMEPYYGGSDVVIECFFDNYGWHYDIEMIQHAS